MKACLSFFLTAKVCLLTFGVLLTAATQVFAQQWGRSSAVSDPFEGQYFNNRYLGNPAMAGLDSVLNLNAAYRKQFSGIPGAPVTQAFSADYNPGKRVGLGLIAYNSTAGLINRSQFVLTYAYHLPVGQWGEQLHFGLSAALSHTDLDAKKIVGDDTDPAIGEFNGRKNAMELDYGMAYTDGHMTLQGSLSNLVSYFNNVRNTTSDVATFYAAAAYKITFAGAVNAIEPQVSLRGVKQYNSIVDAGANITMFHHILNIFGLYHSSGSFSAGVGLNYKDDVFIQGAYLSQTSGLRNYTDGNYEINVGIRLFKRN